MLNLGGQCSSTSNPVIIFHSCCEYRLWCGHGVQISQHVFGTNSTANTFRVGMASYLSWLEHGVSDPRVRRANPGHFNNIQLCCNPFPLSCITFSVIKCQFLSNHAYLVWEVKDPFSRLMCRLRLSPSHLIHHIMVQIIY